jgi:hypothetical protein
MAAVAYPSADELRVRSERAWERVEREEYVDPDALEALRVRTLMLTATEGMIAERRAMAEETAHLLEELLLELTNLCDVRDVIAMALTAAEGRL